MNTKNYLIFCSDNGRFGDIACGVKFAQLMHKNLDISYQNITFATNTSHTVLNLFKNKIKFNVVDFKQAKSIHNIALQIIVPALDGNDVTPYLNYSIPTISLAEYGFDPVKYLGLNIVTINSYSLGLNVKKNELGLLISQKLVDKAFSPNYLPENEIFSEETCSILFKGASYTDFKQHSRLYFSYASENRSYIYFFSSIAEMNKNDHKDITIIAPNFNIMKIDHLKEDFINILKTSGINTIIVENEKSEEKTILDENSSSSLKSLRIICRKFPHTEVTKLFLISEKETLVTGDQSLSEAISANKSFALEVPSHKKALASSLNKLALIKLNQCLTISSFNTENDFLLSVNEMTNRFNHLKSDNYSCLTKFNEYICTNFDCFSKIPSLFNDAIMQTPAALIDIRKEKIDVTTTDFKFDTSYLLSMEQICKMKISTETGISELDFFLDSSFETSRIGPRTYLLKRLHRVES